MGKSDENDFNEAVKIMARGADRIANIKLEDLSEEVLDDEDDCYYVVIVDDKGVQTVKSIKLEQEELEVEVEEAQEVSDDPLVCTQEEHETFQQIKREYGRENQQNDTIYILPNNSNKAFDAEMELVDSESQHDVLAEQQIEVDNMNLINVLNGTDSINDEHIIQYTDDTVTLVNDVLSVEMATPNDSDLVYAQEEIVVENGEEFEIINAGEGTEFIIDYNDDNETITVLQQEDGSFLCDCGSSYMDFADYESHRWTHNPFHCPYCERGFESQEIVTGHMLLHTQGDLTLPCPFCNARIKRHMLVPHVKIQHSSHRPRCTICNKSFANENNLKRHMLLHVGGNYICDICNTRFTQKSSLQYHKLTQCGLINAFQCEQCQKEFVTLNALNIHIEKGCQGLEDSNHIKKTYVCNTCGKQYVTTTSLRSHIELVHNTSNVELLCPECGDVLPSKKAMYAHSYTHRQDKRQHLKRFACSICGKGCSSHAMLLMHERVHTNERPFKCPNCTLAFKTKTHLTTHQLTHTQEKKFGCSVCMKFFALKGNLVVHLRTHTGERPYVCTICDQAFIDSKYLKKHKLRRHNIGNIPWNKYY